MHMQNAQCRRFVTTNQDEFQNPASVRVNRNLDSLEIERYQKCIDQKSKCESELRAAARQMLCSAEQNENREPTLFPTDSHIDENVKNKPSWCRCLATGDPNAYDETLEEKGTDDLCYCKQIHHQMDPTLDSDRQKIFSSTYFIDYRDPDYNYPESKRVNKEALDSKFLEYKKRADALDALKEPKIIPPPPQSDSLISPDCFNLHNGLQNVKSNGKWRADESWWRNETPECIKNLVKKYIWTSTYREMNKDGAALPITTHETPKTCLETPPGDPVRGKKEMAPCTLFDLGDIFRDWDRPQVRTVAGRCDTISNRPCLDYDTYFKDHYLHRAKFARCPETHPLPTEENLRLAREERLRMPYDKMIPGYMGYNMNEAPPVCKVKKFVDHTDPDTDVSNYELDYVKYPEEIYSKPTESYRPIDPKTSGISDNPILAISNFPLPQATRLSCYLECNKEKCPQPENTCNQKIEY